MRIKGDTMDFVISFFRDTLDGGLYYVVVVICLILIMAIIGFIMEKAKIAKEESEKTVVIADSNGVPVTDQEVVSNANSNAATNVTGSVVLTDDDTVSVNTKAKTEEDNFIDFGSTNDDISNTNGNATTSVSVNTGANINNGTVAANNGNNDNTNVGTTTHGTVVNNSVAANVNTIVDQNNVIPNANVNDTLDANSNTVVGSVSNVVPEIQQVNSNAVDLSNINSTTTNVTVTPLVQAMPQVESAIPEIITNVVSDINASESATGTITSSNTVVPSQNEVSSEPELIDLD